MSNLLVSYRDVDIYSEDLQLLNDKQWINDKIINYYYRRLELQNNYNFEGNINCKSNSIYNESILLFDASVVSFLSIQCIDDEEFDEVYNSLNIKEKKYLFIPLTNSNSFDMKSSHWSLLLVDIKLHKVYHLDSISGSNRYSATSFLTTLSKLLKRKYIDIIDVNCPNQENNYDCGIFTILFSKEIYFYLINEDFYNQYKLSEILQSIKPIYCRDMRKMILNDINMIIS